MLDTSTSVDTSSDQNPAAEVRALLLKWANEQPLWKQEALRRILKGDHNSNDVEEIAEAVEKVATKSGTDDFKPISNADFGTSVETHDKFHLEKLHEVQNVNRLASNQVLNFGKTGLTAIYGDNGSGKSGYARIFKRACGARDQESILANVFAEAPAAPASASFVLGGLSSDSLTIPWKNDGSVAEAPLNSIPVFDSRAAPFYVEKSAALAFIPYGLDCFERLATLLDAVAARLNQHIATIDANCAKPLIEGDLQVKAEEAFVALLGLQYPELEQHLVWDSELQKALDTVSEAAADPVARASTLQAAATDLTKFVSELKAAHQLVSDANIQLAIKLRDGAKAAQAAADLSAEELFSAQPLQGIGGESWRMLFEAARNFSTTSAYPGREFPPDEDGDRCVLCLQDLDAAARIRFGEFRSFVTAEISTNAAALRSQLEDYAVKFSEGSAALNKLALDPATRANATAETTELDEVRAAIASRIGTIEQILSNSTHDIAKSLPVGPWEKCLERSAAMELAATELQVLIDSGSAGLLADKQTTLQIRFAFCHSPGPTKLRWQSLIRRANLLVAIQSCSTSNVTKRGGELVRQFVTEKLSQRFDAERVALSITSLEVQLSATAKKGGVERNLSLGKQTLKAAPPLVLSEGEYRASALAAFFAEQSMSPLSTPLVIDDPVSSLDHKRREMVATRIVAEAKTRQVIVFTHDLPFFVMLETACGARQVPWTRVYLERAKGGYGAISDQPAPWDAQGFGERKQVLTQKLSELKKQYADAGDNEEYRDNITVFYDRLRKTWERGLEELVMNNTIVRYRPSLQTLRLNRVSVDDEIYQSFTEGMTNASKITGHDQAAELGGAWPEPATAEGLLADLSAFEALVKTKANQTEKNRKAAAKAPPASQ